MSLYFAFFYFDNELDGCFLSFWYVCVVSYWSTVCILNVAHFIVIMVFLVINLKILKLFCAI